MLIILSTTCMHNTWRACDKYMCYVNQPYKSMQSSCTMKVLIWDQVQITFTHKFKLSRARARARCTQLHTHAVIYDSPQWQVEVPLSCQKGIPSSGSLVNSSLTKTLNQMSKILGKKPSRLMLQLLFSNTAMVGDTHSPKLVAWGQSW